MASTEARTERIQLRLTPTEAAQLSRLSTRLGVSKTQAVRQAVAVLLGEPLAGEVAAAGSSAVSGSAAGDAGQKAMEFQIGRIRSNLTQLAAVGLPSVKVLDEFFPLNEYYPSVILDRYLALDQTDAGREKMAVDLRDRIGKPLAELVLRHNMGEKLVTEDIRAVAGVKCLQALKDEWKAATKAA